MAKGKRTKGQTMIYKTLHRKQTKDWATRTSLKTEGDLMCSGRVGRPRVTSCALEGLADRGWRHVLWKGWQTEGDLMCSGRVGRPRVTSCALEGLADRGWRHVLWKGWQTEGDVMCSGRVGGSCSTINTCIIWTSHMAIPEFVKK
jgi:hypothetical protein